MKRFIFALTLIVSLGTASVFSQGAHPSLQPSFTIENAPVSGRELLESSLLFSECAPDSEQWNTSLQAFDELCKTVRSSEYASLNEEERSEAVLSLLYKNTLTRYSSGQTRVHTALLTGSYNCVSASTLYACLATEAGISVIANETKDHAFCTVITGGKKIDVETTNPGGFNPGTRKEITSSGGQTRYFIVPKKYYSGRKEITLAKLCTLSARNLCSNYNDKNNYTAAIPLAVSRLDFARFLPENEKSAVRSDFDTLCSNYAIDLDHKNAQDPALSWLLSVFNAYGTTPQLLKTYSDIAYNGFATGMNKNDYEGVNSFLSKYETYIPQKALESYRAQILESEWYEKVKAAFNKGEYIRAAEIADEALASLPGNRTITNAKNTALKNHGVTVHNEYARLVNAGKYDEAQKVIEQGLSENPTSTVLQGDLKKLRTYRSN